MQLENYFPNLLSLYQVELQMKSKSRKQSLYFGDRSETTDNLSDTEDQAFFRLRSGTDISDSVNAARYRLNHRRTHYGDPSDVDHESGEAAFEKDTLDQETQEEYLLDDLAETLPIELLLP